MEIILSEVSLDQIFEEDEDGCVRSEFDRVPMTIDQDYQNLLGCSLKRRAKPSSLAAAVMNTKHCPLQYCIRYSPVLFQSGGVDVQPSAYEDDAPIMQVEDNIFFNVPTIV
jgi:hypothetical protein